MKLARRLNAGNDGKCASPEGTADAAAVPALGRAAIALFEISTVPSGLMRFARPRPALKRRPIIVRPSGTAGLLRQ